ncbi:ArsR/SmtB family transcription factor [Microbacterium rhizomatis]|uniref:Winged helix-turn-helix transcriptional regulator n=1 Tax=Microbacterium rhizomatis TaxID=1631477 RepID=A0A5J5J101_9MICO|nr:metalloregulator ArsR/SmtB family transcription factor [Microbacterium rhizomatis]KAA9105619.1 winged helix-turn-helix transcriptional regulator [Microbacterium rhizomatis]
MHPFEVMAEPVRRRIVDILASGEHTSGQIAEVVGLEFQISRSAASKHLRILYRSGFVDVREELNWRWYRLIPAGIDMLESAVFDLRGKLAGAVGWNEDRRQNFDPLAVLPTYDRLVRTDAGADSRGRGRRGRQTAAPPRASEPDQGLYRVPPF